MELEDIKKLAAMARLEMSDDELSEMAHDFEPILAYVSQVQEVDQAPSVGATYILENVMRDDVVINEKGTYTDVIIAQMPDSQDGFLKVKQIL